MNILLAFVLFSLAVWVILRVFIVVVNALVGFFELWYWLVGKISVLIKTKTNP